MKDTTARPTEYRGIVYRSKCEAMFALWLDLRKSNDAYIEYEPGWAEDGNYVADFAIHTPIQDERNEVVVFCTGVELIEYKPSRPTMTYVDEITQRLGSIAKRKLVGLSGVDEILMSLYWGSVYSTDRGCVSMCGDSWTFSRRDWLAGHEKTVREYRFDLMEAE